LFFSEPRPHSVELWCSVSLVFCDDEQVLSEASEICFGVIAGAEALSSSEVFRAIARECLDRISVTVSAPAASQMTLLGYASRLPWAMGPSASRRAHSLSRETWLLRDSCESLDVFLDHFQMRRENSCRVAAANASICLDTLDEVREKSRVMFFQFAASVDDSLRHF
jgi:hypothetical protein